MRKSRFTEAQIIGMIKEQEAGMAAAEVCRWHGLSLATGYKLKMKMCSLNHVVQKPKFGRKSAIAPDH